MSLGKLMVSISIFTAAATGVAGERVQTRSVVMSQLGIAATEHPLASQTAVKVLENGGNAIDAAVAANATMGLVSPMMCGIGGDLFAIVYDARTKRVYGLNASGWSPRRLTREYLTGKGAKTMPTNGVDSVTLPGTVAGWDELLKKFGSKGFRELLAPAIYYAKEGFPVSELVASYWSAEEAKLEADAGASATFLPEGRVPRAGELFRNADLAWSYEQIAKRGAKAFYDGPITGKLLSFLKEKGAPWERADFAEFQARWVEPISTPYRGWRVYEIPPNGQGIAALTMLNILEKFPMSEFGHNSVKALHYLIEAKKLAYADMLRYVADPEFGSVPVKQILSKENAAVRAKLIDAQRASCKVEPSAFETGTDTTYLCVVDKEGNMVSLIQSDYYAFGAGLVAPGTGFVLQNRGGLFTLDPAHPNVLAGRKRPLHTIIPGMMEKDEFRVAFGIMGGWNQAQAHAQFVSNFVDHQLNLQEALDAPRMTKLTFNGCDVKIESRVPEELRKELRGLGHEVQVLPPFAQDVGGGQAVMRDYKSGVNFGASDPRKDGQAIPEQPRLRK